MDNEKPNLPESLFPKEEIFNGGKVIINYLPERLEGLEIETIGWEKLDEERARRVGGFDLLDDLRYALRDITIDTFGKVKAKIMNTTMGLYNRFHRAETEEDIKNLELSMPVGGCAILITTEPDGSNRMVVQYRVDKNEYQDTAGASAGGIMKMQFNDSGYPKPVQEVYREHIASRLSEEIGIDNSQFELTISGLVTEIDPKAHHEIVSVAKTTLPFSEIREKHADIDGLRSARIHLISLPFEKEIIEILVARMACPLPPTHLAAFISAGYMKVLSEEGPDKAKAWVAGLQQKVVENYTRIDEVVKVSGRGDKYRPYSSPANQGLPDLLKAMLEEGLLRPVDRQETVEKQRKFTTDDVCVVGSVMFKDYSTEGTPDNLRGHQAIDSLMNVAKMGGKAAIIVAPNTDSKFKEDLERELEKLGEDKRKLVVLETESQRGYSAARRQSVNLARKSFPETKVIIMQEIEKDLTQAYVGFLKELSGNKVLVMMNRGVNAPYAEYPWPEDTFETDKGHLGANLPGAQFWGERDQNIHMANQEMAAFGVTSYWDRLNGTRVILNAEVEIGGVWINPTDLTLLEWEYTDGYNQEDRKNKMNAYSEAVYNLIPVLESLGGNNLIEQVPTKYWHAEKQREQEENDPNFKAKRLGHEVELPRINFDVVCNILEWKKQGIWPKILFEAINGDKKLHISHFTPEDYAIMNGEVIKRSN